MIQYPSVPINGQATTTQISAFPDTRSIVIYNESQYFLQVTLVGSGTYGLAAYTADAFPVFSGFTGTINVMPTQYITVESGTPPASIMFVQAYGVNEQVSKLLANNQPTGYPLNLSRLQNIGNGSQVAGNASSLVNTNNPANTSIISVTPSDAASPTWSADNEGNVTIKGNNAGTLTTLLQLIAGASPEVNVLGVIIDATNRITIPNNTTYATLDTGGTHRNLIYMDTSNVTHVHNGASASLIQFDSKILGDSGKYSTDGSGNFTANSLISSETTGTGLTIKAASSLDNGAITTDGSGDITAKALSVSNGVTLTGGAVHFVTGAIAREAHGTGTTVASPSRTTIAHGLGAYPYWANIVINSASSTTTYSVEWDATNIYVLAFSGGLSFTWLALA